MASGDPNIKTLNDFRVVWGLNATNSKLISPNILSTYSAILNAPLPSPPITEEQFKETANTLANNIKKWYSYTNFPKQNLPGLNQSIDNLKNMLKFQKVTPTTTPQSGPSPQTLAVANRFFKSVGGAPATVDFAGEFANFKSLSDADMIDINNLISTSTSTANFNKIGDKLKEEGTKIKTEIQNRRTKADAINQQFVDDKLAAGHVSKSKVMVLQDYILAGFAIAFLFFAIVVVFYFTKYSEKPLRSFITLSTLMVVIAAILYTWTSYLA
jgi:hypothetical protein